MLVILPTKCMKIPNDPQCVLVSRKKNEQQCCPASGHPRVHITGDSEDNKVPGAFTENPAAHQR